MTAATLTDAAARCPPLVLIHSPLVGPGCWAPVAAALRARGVTALVPDLHDDPGVATPFWQQHARAAAVAITTLPPDRAPVLVAHSGAGPLLPAIRAAAGRAVGGYLFVDAGLPTAGASRLELMAAESPAFAAQLRASLTAGGRFPAWSEAQLRAIVPDPATRRSLLADLRPRALPFFTEPLPVFAGWPDAPCAYLCFSAPYAAALAAARARGWPCTALAAGHFHLLVDPAAVAEWILAQAPREKAPHPLPESGDHG